jgi:hypothetical protein
MIHDAYVPCAKRGSSSTRAAVSVQASIGGPRGCLHLCMMGIHAWVLVCARPEDALPFFSAQMLGWLGGWWLSAQCLSFSSALYNHNAYTPCARRCSSSASAASPGWDRRPGGCFLSDKWAYMLVCLCARDALLLFFVLFCLSIILPLGYLAFVLFCICVI